MNWFKNRLLRMSQLSPSVSGIIMRATTGQQDVNSAIQQLGPIAITNGVELCQMIQQMFMVTTDQGREVLTTLNHTFCQMNSDEEQQTQEANAIENTEIGEPQPESIV